MLQVYAFKGPNPESSLIKLTNNLLKTKLFTGNNSPEKKTLKKVEKIIANEEDKDSKSKT